MAFGQPFDDYEFLGRCPRLRWRWPLAKKLSRCLRRDGIGIVKTGSIPHLNRESRRHTKKRKRH